MRVIDFLEIFDGFLPVVYYVETEKENETFKGTFEPYEEQLWEGSSFDTPWWVASLTLVKVDYREKFKDDKPGLVIIVEEE